MAVDSNVGGGDTHQMRAHDVFVGWKAVFFSLLYAFVTALEICHLVIFPAATGSSS